MEHEISYVDETNKGCSQCEIFRDQVSNLKAKINQCNHCSHADQNTENSSYKVEDIDRGNSARSEIADNSQQSSEKTNKEDEKNNVTLSMEHSDLTEMNVLVPRGCQKGIQCLPTDLVEPSLGLDTKRKEATPEIKETTHNLKENYVIIDSKDSNFDRVLNGITVLATSGDLGPGAIPKICGTLTKSELEDIEESSRCSKSQENDERLNKCSQKNENSSISESDDRPNIKNKEDNLDKPSIDDRGHIAAPTKSQNSYRHTKDKAKINVKLNSLSVDDTSGSSKQNYKTPRENEAAGDRSPEKPPSSDVQSHPVTQPTDQRYPVMTSLPEVTEEFQASVITDIVNKLQHLNKHCHLLMETKALLEADMIKMEKQHRKALVEMAQNMKQLKAENEALKLNQKSGADRGEMNAQLLVSMKSEISETSDFIHVEKNQQTSNSTEDSLLTSLKVLDEKDRMIEKYKTHMQKLAAANQSWYEQHQQQQAEFTEKLAKMQQLLADKDTAMKLQVKSLQEQQQNLEREIQHEMEQRSAFEKMYKSMRERLEREMHPYRERSEKAEREATMYREQLVKAMDDKDQLHIENRKLQTEAWVKQQAGISPPEGSLEEQLRTQIDVLKHQAATWKDDFERERKDRTRAQAETERQKKKNEGVHMELQNAEYRIQGLTRDLQNLRARNIELERKLRERHNSSPPPLYVATPQPVGSSNHPSRPVNVLDYPSNHPDRWNCRKCTYSNIPERSSCELCGASRESRRTNQGHYTAPQNPSDITFPHYKLSRDVSPDNNYMRH